jgi:hypothetical protein
MVPAWQRLQGCSPEHFTLRLLQLSQADTAVLEWGASGPGLCSIDIIPPRSQISENEVLELLQRMSSYGKTTLAKKKPEVRVAGI